jgi:HTH-type transcriptional regulator/antitoxin HigA
MNSNKRIPFELTTVPHPGETVLEYLDFHEWPQRELARRAALTPKTISEICSGKAPISPSTALAFEKVFERPAHFWLNLQSRYDEAEARIRQLAKSSEWTQWAYAFPLREMRRLKFSLPAAHSDADTLLKYFGVSSPESWESVWQASAVAYRQTRVFNTRKQAIAAWVREVEIVARGLELADFDERRLRGSLETLRALTRKRADTILDPLQEICAAAGVAVVLVPSLPKTGISGCIRWLSERRALIGLTLRFKTEDQLWFTFFHEIGHLLLHRHIHSFVVDNAAEDLGDPIVDPEMEQYEAEANRFARDALIPPKAYSEFVRNGTFTNESIQRFAEEIGIGPGVLVGRLQHDDFLKHHQGNAYKQKLDWGFATEG